MNDLRKFLITRLIAVLIPVILLEELLSFLMRKTLFPFILGLTESGQGLVASPGVRDLLFLVKGLLFGGSGLENLPFLRGTLIFSLIVIAGLVWILPIAGGIVVYAVLAEKKVREIETARENERKEAEKERSLMLSDFAHDLRTPIMTISGYAEALNSGMVTDGQKRSEYLSAIARKSTRLAELINMLFEYVKLDSTGFRLHKKEMDLHEVLLSIAAAAYTDIEEAGMAFEADIPEEPLLVEADEPQLTRVIENLLKNAVRHNPQGTKIALLVQRIPLGEEIIVADSGVAIQKSEEELFAPFVRGDSARSGDKGSGLGLSIAKKVADMHGYSLHLRQPFRGGAGHEDISFTKAFVLQVGID